MLTSDQLDIRLETLLGAGHRPAEFHLDAESGASLAIPDAHLLFEGDYHRTGFDLIISDAAARVTIHDYFRAGKRPSLVAPNGATLTDDVVAALTTSDLGDQYAQNGPGTAGQQIGRVETMTGSASAVRNGVSIGLNPGDPVFRGDAVQTSGSSSLGLSFVDGTVFSLSSNARMVLNEMVYQPGGQSNSAVLTLVQGSIGFLAGQVAKTGDMRVGTPVATMGIRGTLVFTENPPEPTGNTITSVNGVVSFSIGREADGRVGIYDVTPLNGAPITVNDPTRIVYVTPGGSFSEDAKPPNVLQAEIGLTQLIYQIAALAQANPLQPGGTPTGPQGGGGPGSSTPPDITGAPSPTPGGPGNGGRLDPIGQTFTTPDPVLNTGAPQTVVQPNPPFAQQAPVPVVQQTTTSAPATNTGTGATGGTTQSPTSAAPPPLASQTVPLGQNDGVAVVDPRAGLLYSGGANDATVSTERVSFVERGAQDDANHVAVDPGQNGTTISGDYGTLDVHADGTYSYVPLRAVALAENEVGFDRFTYTATNQDGQSAAATLTFRITGVNDAPAPVSDTAAAAGGNRIAATSRATGLLGNDTDPDHNETATLHITAVSAATGSDTTTTPVTTTGTTSIHGRYGTLQLASDGTYSYVQDPTSPLAAGQVGTETFTYTVEDSHVASDNGSATGAFTIQVTGAGPFLDLNTADGSAQTGYSANYAGNGTPVTSPNVAITDPDAGTLAAATISVRQGGNVDTQDTLSIDSGTLSADHLLFSGSSGTYTLTTAPGQTATVANYADALAHLKITAGSTTTPRDITLSVVANDGTHQGNTATSTIHIVPTSFSGSDTGSVVEAGYGTDGTPTSTGTLHDTLADGRTDAFQTDSGTLSTQGYGTYTVTSTGTWTYTLDNNNASVQAFAAGQHVGDTITLRAADGTAHIVTIDITGTNDAPVTHSDTNSYQIGSTGQVAGNVLTNDTDPENNTFTVTGLHDDAATTSYFANGIYGLLTLNHDGSYTYTPGNTADQQAADRTLAAGETETDKFTYTTTDSLGASTDGILTISVTGVNDAPNLHLDSGSVNYATSSSGSETHVTSQSVSITDPDTGATVSGAVLTIDSSTYHTGDVLSLDESDPGTFTLESFGSGGYTLTPIGDAVSDAAFAAELQHVVFTPGDTDGDRSVSVRITVDDGTDTNTATSNEAVSTISVTAPPPAGGNTAPVLDLDGTDVDYGASYTGAGTHVTSQSVTIADGDDDASIVSGTLVLDGDAVDHGDILSLDSTAPGTVTLTSQGNGTYILSNGDAGALSDADFAAALQHVVLTTGTNNGMRSDTVTITVNDGFDDSNVATATIDIPADAAPTVKTSNAVAAYTLGGGAVQVDGGLQVTDSDSTTIVSATVAVHLGDRTYQTGDTLGISVGGHNGFTVDSATMHLTFTDGAVVDQRYDGETGILTLTSEGSATVADFQNALQQVQFSATGDEADTRYIDFTVNDGTLNSTVATDRATVNDAVALGSDDLILTPENTSYTETLPISAGSGSFFSLDQPMHGQVTQTSENHTVVYTPDSDYVGSDSFIYRVSSGGQVHAYTVTVGVDATEGGQFGASLVSLGDTNGDGISDTGAGAPGTNPSAFIPEYVNASGTFSFGQAIAAFSDLNGDAIPDVAVGAPANRGGTVYLYQGSGINDTAPTLVHTITGANNGDQAGFSLASAGQYNPGATPDLVIGAPTAGGSGSAYVVYGEAINGDLNLGSLGSAGITIHGHADGDQFGYAVAGGGDIDSDGRADIVVGAPGAQGGAGEAYVIFGSNTSNIDLSSSESDHVVDIVGQAAGDQFGHAVANLGDINGDGFDDFAIGAPGADNGTGAVYVVYGAANLTSVDLSDIVAGTGGFVVYGQHAGDHFGSSVAGAGDVDGDGLADILIGAPNVSNNQNIDNGAAYLILGSTTGANVSVSETDVVLPGLHAGDEVGTSVSTTADSSGTGLAGYAAGAPRAYDNSSNTIDRGYYTFSSHAPVAGLVQGTRGNDDGSDASHPALRGSVTAADNLDGLQGNDRLVGLGGGDHLIGASGADTFVFSATDGAGRNTIADFHAASATAASAQRDIIEIDGYTGIQSFAALQSHLSQVNSHDTLIQLDNNTDPTLNHSILLKNVLVSSLAAGDFHFGLNASA